MKKCNYCGGNFTPGHGNQQYCTSQCKILQKAATQKKLYGVLKEFRKGYLTNYKLFEKVVSKSGSKTIPLSELKNKGFQSNCYYGAYTKDKSTIFYKIGEYHFSMFTESQIQYIKIIKD